MKFRLLALALMAFAASAFAQSAPFKEVIHLKNGSVLKGLITEWVPGSSLTIQLADSSIFVCPMSDVAKVTREFTPVASKASKVATTPVIPQDYEFFASVGYGINSGKYGLDVVNFNLGYGKNVSSNHFVGLGTGLRYFLTDNEFAMMPLYAEYRGRMERGHISPYTRIALGYSLNLSQGIENSGVLFNPRIGLEFNAGASRLSFDMGYQTQQMPFYILNASDPFNPYFDKIYRFSEALCFNVGLIF
jgi:hypothetical protein